MRLLRALLSVVIATGGLMLLSSPAANAGGACGFAYKRAFSYSFGGVTIRVPGAALNHCVVGRGLTVERQYASFSSAAKLCNWRIDFVYYDDRGNQDVRYMGATHHSCTRDAYRELRPSRGFGPGKTCAKVYMNGKWRETQCHSLTP